MNFGKLFLLLEVFNMELLKKEIFLACKILVEQKLSSGPFGNISARLPGQDYFFINACGKTFENLHEQDIVGVDLQGKTLQAGLKPHPGEFIHRAIYQLRPDVNAIVHTHSHHTVLISLLGVPIQPFTQLGASIYNDQAIHYEFTGPVRDYNEGLSIAKDLGNKSIVIAKNHGLFTVSHNIQSALWDFIIADTASAIHLDAIKIGLYEAETLPQHFLEKSRNEVRELQYEFMWQNYLGLLNH